LAKPFTTVGADPFYGQTSRPRPPKFLQAYLKLAAEVKWPKKIQKKIPGKFSKKISRKNFKKNIEIFLEILK
jgi:hypothetical protein